MQNFNDRMKEMLSGFKKGKVAEQDIVRFVKASEFEDVGFAKIDHKRSMFKNFPEVIFGTGKTDDQIFEIFTRMAARGGNVIATRISEKVFARLKKKFSGLKHDKHSSIAYLRQGPQAGQTGKVVVMTAGTADIGVAEEAALTAELSGSRVERVYDVGVAGIKRFFANLGHVMDARVIVVAAGMEGALASVVSGLSPVPVIAVPTSVGYGASFKGLAALLAMLNCCSPGVSVVNIDNGFGAGYLASQINLMSGAGASAAAATPEKKRRGRPPGSGKKSEEPARRGRKPGKKRGRKPGRPAKSGKIKKAELLPGAATPEKKRRGRPPGIEALRKKKPGRKPGKKTKKALSAKELAEKKINDILSGALAGEKKPEKAKKEKIAKIVRTVKKTVAGKAPEKKADDEKTPVQPFHDFAAGRDEAGTNDEKKPAERPAQDNPAPGSGELTKEPVE